MKESRMGGYRGVELNETEHFELEAVLAADLVTKWGMVSGAPNGEDSSGRQQCRLLDPSEVVDRALSTAEILMKRLREKGLIFATPTFVEMDEAKKEKELLEIEA